MKFIRASLLSLPALAAALLFCLPAGLPAVPVSPSATGDLPAETADYKLPALDHPDSWSIVLFPDIQAYIRYDRNYGLLDIMNTWVVENIPALNIQFALFSGDLVNDNERLYRHLQETPLGVRPALTSPEQWAACARAFGRLDHKLPYVTCTGNHDYGYYPGNAQNRDSGFPEYFPANKNPLNLPHIVATAKNARGAASLENAAFEFTPPGGRKLLVVSLEYAPRDEIIEWAGQLCGDPLYENHTVIILTHAYLHNLAKKSVRLKGAAKKLPGANDGEAIWEKLVKPSRNIQLVICGHIAAPEKVNSHIGFRVDRNAAGRRVNQMLFNAQALGGGWRGNGGDGWLRWLEFYPDNKTVKVKTFSPLFAISPATRHLAWRKDKNDEFTFELD
ncbi:MAG: metallophosphoesterase [Opitutaceae bacterium]|jgi:hypothetical protein|nr:metallophosphoesterase [Opitutaceae bacterium]